MSKIKINSNMRVEYIIPLFADAISGAFGAAIVGNYIWGNEVTTIAAIIGGVFMLLYGLNMLRKKIARQKSDRKQPDTIGIRSNS